MTGHANPEVGSLNLNPDEHGELLKLLRGINEKLALGHEEQSPLSAK